MKKEEIIKLLKEVSDEVEKKHKARTRGIFGSFVRGEQKERSNIIFLLSLMKEQIFLI